MIVKIEAPDTLHLRANGDGEYPLIMRPGIEPQDIKERLG
jgi:hypothetical protein